MNQQKRIVITGGGSGLGRALATVYGRKGWRVCVVDMDGERGNETVRIVKESGGEGFVHVCDVTSTGAFEALVEVVTARWGGVDILVNNAGVAAVEYFQLLSDKEWDWIMDVNLRAVIHGCRYFIPLMAAQGSGHIVNIASCAGIVSLPEMCSYNVTKAGVISLSETLRAELSTQGICVTVAAPTFFQTNIMERLHVTDERQLELASNIFCGCKTTAEEVALKIERAVRRKKLYVIPQWDGKISWWIKRLSPEFFHRLMAVFYKRKGFERVYGVRGDGAVNQGS